MIGASLAMLLLLGQAPSASPTALVEQLGSPRFAERERATEAPADSGPAPCPPCVPPASQGSGSPREGGGPGRENRGLLLTQPTLVTLDIKDRPLTEAVEVIGDQAGIKLALTPEFPPPGNARDPARVRPLAVLEGARSALRRGQLAIQPRDAGLPATAAHPHPFRGEAGDAGPISDLGPFRAQSTNLHFQRDVTFAAVPRPSEQFYMQVQVAAEPRLSVSQNGGFRFSRPWTIAVSR